MLQIQMLKSVFTFICLCATTIHVPFGGLPLAHLRNSLLCTFPHPQGSISDSRDCFLSRHDLSDLTFSRKKGGGRQELHVASIANDGINPPLCAVVFTAYIKNGTKRMHYLISFCFTSA